MKKPAETGPSRLQFPHGREPQAVVALAVAGLGVHTASVDRRCRSNSQHRWRVECPSMTNLRFGIRDLLWAMVVMGLMIGWWGGSRESARAFSALETRYVELAQDDLEARLAIRNSSFRIVYYGQTPKLAKDGD
jgi:hypothetical protein